KGEVKDSLGTGDIDAGEEFSSVCWLQLPRARRCSSHGPARRRRARRSRLRL
ncbi:unnamed protein product, partial [Ectocarpus sp. 12 AP-2014]